MKRSSGLWFLLLMLVALVSGCGGKGGDSSSTGAALSSGKLGSAEATSKHYVKVAFKDEITQQSVDELGLSIVASDGEPLTIYQTTLSKDGTSALLQTGPQRETQYQLRFKHEVTSTSSSDARQKGVSARSIDATYDFIPFNGSIEPEPYIKTVISTTNTTVLVTMSDPMDAVSVELSGDALNTAFRITAGNDSRPREDVGDLVVRSAKLDPLNKARIVLTTSEQFDIEYFVTIANVYSLPPVKLIQPLRNKMSFFGINKVDITGPKLIGAVTTGNTSAMLYFSEPLSNSAARSLNFTVCTSAYNASNNCPSVSSLFLTNAELTAHNTQIQLTTLPQQSGVLYRVKAENLRDRATPAPGNLQVPNPDFANFSGSGKGAPQVVSALADDNTHVLVKFSERMSNSVLSGSSYRIENPPLDVSNTVERVDDRTVRITTTTQERREYKIAVVNVQSEEGLLIDPEHNSANFVGMASKDIDKPRLLGAEAETRTRTRLFFSEPLSETATKPSNYTVAISACPVDDSTCIVGANLTVVSAQLELLDTQVVITTNEPQAARVEYVVMVGAGVTDKAMPLPHNSFDVTSNTAKFGILLDDKDAPKLLSATATSTTEITLNFNEAMGAKAGDPSLYIVCSTALGANGRCPSGASLQVLSATLSSAGTQVTLKTMPMVAGVTYVVAVSPNVADVTGNKMNGSNVTTSFSFSGATAVSDAKTLPHVVGAISTSNTTVTVSFSALMGSSALNVQNYLFTQVNVNGEVGTVFVMGVKWKEENGQPDLTAVEVATTSQNEVTYRVTVVNVKDAYGNPLDSKRVSATGVLYEPSSAVFAGSPPVAQALVLSAGNWRMDAPAGDFKAIAGRKITVDGKSIVLADINLDGVVDNWIDTDNNGVISNSDIVTGIIDSDGDGISDNEELRGGSIAIVMSNGQALIRQITSDPTKRDTDGDGLTDQEEWAFGMDPRSADTDSDGLSDYIEWNVLFSAPADQDSDNDTLQDGLEHTFFRTSAILADTDGDQFDDAKELLALNRDPRVADLPNIKIHVGDVRLQIDERYTRVNANGETVSNESSTNATLTSSENTSFSNSVETLEQTVSSFEWGVGFGLRDAQTDDSAVNGNEVIDFKAYLGSLFGRLFVEVSLGGTNERTTGTTIQVDKASARGSQQAYENSLAKGNEQSASNEVTRELVGARISASVSVENVGNVAMTVKNLQISVLQIDPQNPNKLLPIATLIAESSVLLGNGLQINLGPFNKSKGPFVFTNNTVYPNLVEALMRDPTSLVFKVVNYDITDEYDRNFAFASQLARDRTAGIIFDFGELGSEEHYVATNGVYDSGSGMYMGGFDAVGKPKGIPLGYLLETVLGINKHDASQDYIDAGSDGIFNTTLSVNDAIADGVIKVGANGVIDSLPAGDDRLRNSAIETGIIAGADKRVDTIAQGDDVQRVPFGSTGVAPKTLVIGPGINGVLESDAAGDDQQEFVSGYELRTTCAVSSPSKNRIGEYCTVSDSGCACSGPKGLYRVKTFRNGDFGNTWFARFNGDVPAAADFDSIIVKPGQDMRLAFLQDLDKDGLFAHEEFLYGSTDSSVNQFDNSKFGPTLDAYDRARAKTPQELGGVKDDFADSIDSDRDGLGDLSEAKLGWLISRNGELKKVFSNPGLADSDGDGLWDIQEQDLRNFCQPNDWRQDALCSRKTVAQTEATGIIVGKNGRLDTLKGGDDEYALFVPKNVDANTAAPDTDGAINRGFLFGTVVILPGKNGVIDTVLAAGADDEYTNAESTLPATDPLLSDTDQDRVSDGDELYGYAAAMSIIEGAETENDGTVSWGIANTRAQGDDVQRIFPASRSSLNAVIVSAGANGILETTPESNDMFTAFWYIAAGADRTLNCQVSTGSTDSVQSVATATTKLDPYAPAIWNKNGTLAPTLANNACYVTALSQDVPGKDVKLYGKIVTTDPLRRDSEGDRIADGFEVALGSDPTVDDGTSFRDADMDGLSDAEELQGWIAKVNGGIGKLVRSNAALPDTDYDGLPDYVERDIGTDPTKRDTDGDGLDDYAEFRSISRQVNFDVNGDLLTNADDKLTYSVYDYAFMPNVYSGFKLVVNAAAHNTDPNRADTDGDRLSDYAEVVTGYQIMLTGQNVLGPVIFTNPNNKDSDGDGLNDDVEAKGTLGAITNAASADTDGDGRSDGVELAVGSLTNPLVPDAQLTVAYDSLFASNLDDCILTGGKRTLPDGTQENCPTKTNLMWWFYVTGSDDGKTRTKRMLSSSDEFAYVPDGSVKAVASGHTSLVDSSSLNSLSPSENPNTSSIRAGLKMTATKCESAKMETGCAPYFTVKPGEQGYSAIPTINFGHGGIPGASVNFIVHWDGEIYAPAAGEYKFRINIDDGTRLFIDNTSVLTKRAGVAATDAEIWNDHSGVDMTGTITLSIGWHPIQVQSMNVGGPSQIQTYWTPAGVSTEIPLSISSLRHSLGNGSYACVALERDTRQASYISLARRTSLDTTAVPVAIYEPGLPYYGSTAGSELKIFLNAVDKDPAGARYYIDVANSVYTTKQFVATALDLAASRGIVDNLVRSDFDSQTVQAGASLQGTAGNRYFELSEAGRLLYKQLKSQDRYGQQSFVVRPKENVEISGVLMKVDNIDDLSGCPVGSKGVVVEFGASCIKRFTKTVDYAEAVQRGTFSLSLRDMQTETFSTNGAGAAGCDIDVTTTINNQ